MSGGYTILTLPITQRSGLYPPPIETLLIPKFIILWTPISISSTL